MRKLKKIKKIQGGMDEWEKKSIILLTIITFSLFGQFCLIYTIITSFGHFSFLFFSQNEIQIQKNQM